MRSHEAQKGECRANMHAMQFGIGAAGDFRQSIMSVDAFE
jgi:hypothetical protein